MLEDRSYDPDLAIAREHFPTHSTVHKFGRNAAVGTTLVPVAIGGVYQTPTEDKTIVIVSSDANDTAAGTGAREVTVTYLDSNFEQQTATLALNGTSESTETITGVRRLYRAYVSKSGTYATAAASSHAGVLTLREPGAGATWAVIDHSDGIGMSQTQIAAYTVPAGKTAYMRTINYSVDSGKNVNLRFFQRQCCDCVEAPYSAMRLLNAYDGLTDTNEFTHGTYEMIPEKTDIGFMAVVAVGTAVVSAEFEMILVDNED